MWPKYKLLQMNSCDILRHHADLIRLNKVHLCDTDNSGFRPTTTTYLKIPQTALTGTDSVVQQASWPDVAVLIWRQAWVTMTEFWQLFALQTWCLFEKSCTYEPWQGRGQHQWQATPDVVYWPAAEATTPVFADKCLHTVTGEQQQQSQQKHEQQHPFCCFCHKQEKVFRSWST